MASYRQHMDTSDHITVKHNSERGLRVVAEGVGLDVEGEGRSTDEVAT